MRITKPLAKHVLLDHQKSGGHPWQPLESNS